MWRCVCYCSIILSSAFSAKLSLADLYIQHTESTILSLKKHICSFLSLLESIWWNFVTYCERDLLDRKSTNTSVSSIYKKLHKFTFFGIWVITITMIVGIVGIVYWLLYIIVDCAGWAEDVMEILIWWWWSSSSSWWWRWWWWLQVVLVLMMMMIIIIINIIIMMMTKMMIGSGVGCAR